MIDKKEYVKIDKVEKVVKLITQFIINNTETTHILTANSMYVYLKENLTDDEQISPSQFCTLLRYLEHNNNCIRIEYCTKLSRDEEGIENIIGIRNPRRYHNEICKAFDIDYAAKFEF